jgi:hypothetical protein
VFVILPFFILILLPFAHEYSKINVKQKTIYVYDSSTSLLYKKIPVYNNGKIQRVVIIRDNGGFISNYSLNMYMLMNSGIRIEIKGSCASACTLYLGYKDICAYKGAKLLIHSSYVSGKNIKGADKIIEKGNSLLWGAYNEKLRKDILKNGGLTKNFKEYIADKYIKRCNGENN